MLLCQQVVVRDDTIQKLNMEIGKLKGKHQEKMSEIAKQTETVKKLQEALTKCHMDLDKTRGKSEEEVRRREDTIKQLQEDLMESQAQYSACYNEVISHHIHHSIINNLLIK